MKKLITLGLLSAAALAWAAAPASAWWPCKGLCCKSKCCSTICVRQYNAFTPICCGNLCCDGCCPMTFGGCCNFGGMGMANQSCCIGNSSCLGELPAAGALASTMTPPVPEQSMPMPNAAAYGSMPMNPYAGYNPYAMGYNPYMMNNVQPAAFQPSMYPGYMPTAPFAGQTPYYWNAGGR